MIYNISIKPEVLLKRSTSNPPIFPMLGVSLAKPTGDETNVGLTSTSMNCTYNYSNSQPQNNNSSVIS